METRQIQLQIKLYFDQTKLINHQKNLSSKGFKNCFLMFSGLDVFLEYVHYLYTYQ